MPRSPANPYVEMDRFHLKLKYSLEEKRGAEADASALLGKDKVAGFKSQILNQTRAVYPSLLGYVSAIFQPNT